MEIRRSVTQRRSVLMPASYSGGCACGAIRYTCAEETIFAWKFHCRDCQRSSGSAFVTAVYVPKPALTVAGEVRYCDTQSRSGNTVSRGFCPECGAPVLASTSKFPAFVGIFSGSLDEPSRVRTTMEAWTASAQPWDYLDPALSKFETQPTEGQMRKLFT
jgi:hypothetical protein